MIYNENALQIIYNENDLLLKCIRYVLQWKCIINNLFHGSNYLELIL